MKPNLQKNFYKYLPTDMNEYLWDMAVSSVGFHSIQPHRLHESNLQKRISNKYELIYIMRGKATFSSLECPEQHLSKGDVLIIHPEQQYICYPNEETGWDRYSIIFFGKDFDRMLKHLVSKKSPVFHIGIKEHIVNHFDEMINCVMTQFFCHQTILASLTLHIISEIHSISQTNSLEPCNMQKIQEACLIIQECIYDKTHFEDIATSLNMSYSNFRKLFKLYIGLSPLQYLLDLKISKIKEFLCYTDLSIFELSVKLNFESPEYFSYFFKSRTGVTPATYRKDSRKVTPEQ